jgi:hypothetical protein
MIGAGAASSALARGGDPRFHPAMRFDRRLVVLVWAVSLATGCDCSGPTPSGACTSNGDCAAGVLCVDGTCVARPDGGRVDGGGGADSGIDGGGCAAPRVACGAACCAASERCWESSACIPDLGTCASNDECSSDSRCVSGVCVPWGTPPAERSDPTCTRSIDIGSIEPDVQCRWTGPPMDDPFSSHVHVMATPVVVDFDFDDDPATLRPSIVFATFPTVGSYGMPGVLRVIDGATCAHQFTAADPADAVMSPAPVALGDLDGDGRAEIVAAAHRGGVLAFAWDAGTGRFVRRWRSGTCDGAGGRAPDATGGTDRWSGPSIHDLDDDGAPEVIYGATVYDRDGCIRSSTLGFANYGSGYVPVIADVDEDGRMELVLGNGLYEWAGGAWVAESDFAAGGLAAGQVAVAELGDFPLSGGEDRAEIVVVSAGTVRVQTIEGAVVFGPLAIPGGGNGGPPTVADFDGDGRRELASAGGSRYAVFDLDCTGTPDPTRCASMRSDGILWTQPSQDNSSNVTGSSVFDFDADGAAEAVYADECFLRIYAGATGAVLYSAARSSGTTYENPVIVDVDGDFNTEIVSAVNDYAGTLGCPPVDPLRAGASFSTSRGILVLRDVSDRWAASRPVWSQHAYHVTHVGDRGEIPRTRDVAVNWRDPELNNFRQNVQGGLDALGVPDLTTAAVSERLRLPCDESGRATLRARVCNRGALPMAAGFVVEFREGARDGAVMCRAESATFLEVGSCEVTSCEASLPSDRAVDVHVVADPDATAEECWEGNNFGLQPNVACETVD